MKHKIVKKSRAQITAAKDSEYFPCLASNQSFSGKGIARQYEFPNFADKWNLDIFG